MAFEPVIVADEAGYSFIDNILKVPTGRLGHEFEAHVVNWCREHNRKASELPFGSVRKNHNQRESSKRTTVRDLLRAGFGE